MPALHTQLGPWGVAMAQGMEDKVPAYFTKAGGGFELRLSGLHADVKVSLSVVLADPTVVISVVLQDFDGIEVA